VSISGRLTIVTLPDTMVEETPPPDSSVATRKASPPKRLRADSGSSTSVESKYVPNEESWIPNTLSAFQESDKMVS
jgi:hypothetical protein